MELIQQDSLSLKQIRLYNPLLLSKYLNIRYKVFICEMNRRIIFGEFHFNDLPARHYVLQLNNKVIGTARLIYEAENIVRIGRVAILENYRNKGYGGFIVNRLLEIIKDENLASVVSLFSEDNRIDFYKRLGFVAREKIFTFSVPVTYMVINV